MKDVQKIFVMCLIIFVVSTALRAEELLASKELIQALDARKIYAFFKVLEKAGMLHFK